MIRLGVMRAPDLVLFGAGSVRAVPREVAALGTRALVVVDPFLASSAPFLSAMRGIESAGVAVLLHDHVIPELPVEAVEDAANRARGFAPDVVVGWGGGSALDLAKLIALLLAHEGPLSEYYGEHRLPGPILPLVAVPTTAGTGSEVTPIAVVSDSARSIKVGVADSALVPRVAIVDPELTIGAPPTVTAFAGIDAVVHAVEAYTARAVEPRWAEPTAIFVGRNPLSSALAIEAVAAMVDALPVAFAQPENADARERMAYGSLLAGLAFGSAGTHLSHALQYPIGAATRTPHGLGTGMLLPYVLSACADHISPQLDELSVAMGGRSPIATLAALNEEIGIPRSLREMGVDRSDLSRFAELALTATRLVRNAPIDATPALLEQILVSAYEGDLRSPA